MFEEFKSRMIEKKANNNERNQLIESIRMDYETNVTDALTNPYSPKAISIPYNAKVMNIRLDSIYHSPNDNSILKGSFRYAFDDEELDNKVDCELFRLDSTMTLQIESTRSKIKGNGQLYPLSVVALSIPKSGLFISLKELLGETEMHIDLDTPQNT